MKRLKQAAQWLRKNFLFCLSALPAIPGAVMIVYALLQNYAERSWPVTSGVVTSGETRLMEQRTDAFLSARIDVVLYYRYQINGQSYSGSRICGGGPFYDEESDAKRAIADWVARKEVKISWMPNQPNRSCLNFK